MTTTINASTTAGLVQSADLSGVLQLQTANTAALTIDASQNVGIGTTSPYGKMNIAGGRAFFGGNNEQYSIGVGYNQSRVNTGAQVYYIGATDSATPSLVFSEAGGTERMRIDSSGNLMIGTTSYAGYYAGSKFSSISATAACAATLATQYSGDVSSPALYLGKYDNNTTTSQIFVRFLLNNGANPSGQINANGANAAAFGTWSDISLKENIEPLPSQLDNIMSLKPSEFDFKDGSGHQIGFIAQDIQKVYPDVVASDENGLLMVTGWSKTEARLVKAIQELSAKVDAQQQEINALKGNV